MKKIVKFRLAYIEMKLVTVGAVHRNDLLKAFGVSKPQATIDLRRYREMYPNNVEYDPGPRQYRRKNSFVPAALFDADISSLLVASQAMETARRITRFRASAKLFVKRSRNFQRTFKVTLAIRPSLRYHSGVTKPTKETGQ